MTIGGGREEFDAALKSLQTYDADPESVKRIRGRCLVTLQAQRQGDHWYTSFALSWRRWLEPAAALTLSVFYLVDAVRSSLALLR